TISGPMPAGSPAVSAIRGRRGSVGSACTFGSGQANLEVRVGAQLTQEAFVFLIRLARAERLACLVAFGIRRAILGARSETFQHVPAGVAVESFADLSVLQFLKNSSDSWAVAVEHEPAHVATEVGGRAVFREFLGELGEIISRKQ